MKKIVFVTSLMLCALMAVNCNNEDSKPQDGNTKTDSGKEQKPTKPSDGNSDANTDKPKPQKCDPGFFGSECTKCQDCGPNATCNDGKSGDGSCICKNGFFGNTCTACPNCGEHGTCDDGNKGGGSCICKSGYKGTLCDEADEDIINTNFSKCTRPGGEYNQVTADFCQLTDTRDKQKYQVALIGEQIWTAENMRYAVPEHFSAGNESANDNTYGLLYNYNVAQNVCPTGWHLPTKAEFEVLRDYVKANRTSSSLLIAFLAKSALWTNHSNEGNDDFGFSMLPAGIKNISEVDGSSSFDNLGKAAFIWTATANPVVANPDDEEEEEEEAEKAYFFGATLTSQISISSIREDSALSVRCLQDIDNCGEHGTYSRELARCVCSDDYVGDKCDTKVVVTPSGNNFSKCTMKNGKYDQAKDSDCVITDTRDNEKYQVVLIDKQVWLRENIRTKQGVQSSYHSANNDSKNDKTYGLLYMWSDAKNICPEGWRLPTKAEFEDLLRYAGDESDIQLLKLRAEKWTVNDWGEEKSGMDSFGFGALPAGRWDGRESEPEQFGMDTSFWSGEEPPDNKTLAYYLYLSTEELEATVARSTKNDWNSVRCIKE